MHDGVRNECNIYWGYNNSVLIVDARLVVLVWTPRSEVRRIISMRKANNREKTLYASYLE